MNLAAQQARMRRRNEVKRLNTSMRKRLWKYGINAETFLQILEDQKHRCAICDKPFNNKRQPHVDHCHIRGHVRGVLCRHCNWALGQLGDDLATLKSAVKYLFFNSLKRRWWRQTTLSLDVWQEIVAGRVTDLQQ